MIRRYEGQLLRLFLLLGVLLSLSPLSTPAAGSPTLPEGLAAQDQSRSMPAFELPNANGETIRSADLQGKVVVVRFWATWWTICQSEMPSVQRVHETFKDKDVVVLAISVDGGGEKAVKSFMTKRGYTFTTPVDVSMDIARKFGVRGVPTTYVINRQGAIVAHGFGPIDFESPAFVQYIQTLAVEPRG